MSAEQRPSRHVSADQEGMHRQLVDLGYAFLAYPKIEAGNPQRTMKELFRSAILVEANLSQVISVAAGRGITELAIRGVPLADSANVRLTDADAKQFAQLGTHVHDITGVPPIPEKGMAKLLKDVVYPLAAVGGALNAIKSLGDEQIVPQGVKSIVASPADLPSPEEAFAGAQQFLNADPHNPYIAQKAFKVSMNTLLSARSERNFYHLDLARVANAGLPREERASELLRVRGSFGGQMIDRLGADLTPDTVPGATKKQLHAFANNIVAYVKLS